MEYDLVLPVGERCHTYAALKDFFQCESLLFGSLGGISMPIVCECLSSDFNNFLLLENLIWEGGNDASCYWIIDKTNNARINHLFKCSFPFDESLHRYYPILERLKRRTLTYIQRSERILFVHATCEFSYSTDELVHYSRTIRQLYPTKICDFLYFMRDENVVDYVRIYHTNGISVYKIPVFNRSILPPKITEQPSNEMAIFGNIPVMKQALTSYILFHANKKSLPLPCNTLSDCQELKKDKNLMITIARWIGETLRSKKTTLRKTNERHAKFLKKQSTVTCKNK